MENFTLNTMVEKAKAAGYKKIIGEYLPTPKNKMVENHYTGLGFAPVEGAATAQFELNVNEYQNRECYIETKDGE
jgi:predicted enzyme involved in methoxymalonyl-ACP biosynthesis